MGGPLREALDRFIARTHAKRHVYAERDALAALATLSGDEFEAARAHALELAMCVDPGHCDHI